MKSKIIVQNTLFVWKMGMAVTHVNARKGFSLTKMDYVKVLHNKFIASYLNYRILIICIDIDECANGHRDKIGHHSCPSDEACVNTLGSFTCQCPDGYQLSFDGNRNRCEGTNQ